MDIKEMIKQTKNSLMSADADRVQLYFMQKHSSSATKKSWGLLVLKSNIPDLVGQKFIDGAKKQFDEIPSDVEYVKYGELTGTDRNIIEYVLISEVSRLYDAVIKLANPDAMENFLEENIANLWGYVAYIECEETSLVLFNKFAASKLPLKTVTLHFLGEELVLVPSQTLVLSTECDVALLLPNRSDFDKLPVCIFNESKFEILFGHYDTYQRQIEGKKEEVYEQLLIDDPKSFLEGCLQNPLKIKKMRNIVEHSELMSITKEQIEQINTSYDLGLTLENGKIIATKQNAWNILRLYNDDCVRSAWADSRYLAYSKKRVGN